MKELLKIVLHRIAIGAAFAASLVGGGLIASAQSTSAAKKKTAPTTKKKTASTKSAASKTKSATSKKSTGTKSTGTRMASTKGRRSSASSKKSSAPKQAWRSRQLAPEPERYREIQSALSDKGYFKGSPTGVWDSESQAALRRFQEDQNLEPTGKLDSLSLIALGLGPKRENGVAKPQQPAAPAPPQQ